MNLFNNLSRRYGQSCIKEVRSWEGREHKLTWYKCHLHFNLRCLSENIVPKGVKLNLKQFQSKTEKEILCKTHRSIINYKVRHCNNIIKDLKLQITQIQDKIKGITSSTDFNNITKQINKTKERVFTTTKPHQIKKFNFLKKTPAYRNTPEPDIIRKKWDINLPSKPLTDGEQSLLQKGPKFAVSSSRVPLTEYIIVTKRICDELGENTTGKDCTEIYQKNQRDPASLQKEEIIHSQHHQRGEGGHQNPQGRCLPCVVLTADKGVALVVMDKSQYVDKCMALLDDTKVYKPCKDTTKRLHRDIQETLGPLNREHGSSRLYW